MERGAGVRSPSAAAEPSPNPSKVTETLMRAPPGRRLHRQVLRVRRSRRRPTARSRREVRRARSRPAPRGRGAEQRWDGRRPWRKFGQARAGDNSQARYPRPEQAAAGSTFVVRVGTVTSKMLAAGAGATARGGQSARRIRWRDGSPEANVIPSSGRERKTGTWARPRSTRSEGRYLHPNPQAAREPAADGLLP